MNNRTVIFLLIHMTIVLCPFTYALDSKGTILFPGNTVDEGKWMHGLKSLALHQEKDKWLLSTTILKAKAVDADGEVIEISSPIKDAVAFINYKNIKQGEVKAAKVAWNVKDALPRASKVPIRITLNSDSYSLYKKGSSFILTGARGTSSMYSGRDDLRIIWAGDIDRDGSLDLIIASGEGGGKNEIDCLLLSSIATNGNLIKEAACQSYIG